MKITLLDHDTGYMYSTIVWTPDYKCRFSASCSNCEIFDFGVLTCRSFREYIYKTVNTKGIHLPVEIDLSDYPELFI